MAQFGPDGQWMSHARLQAVDLDAVLDVDRVGIAIQAVLGGLSVPRTSQGWPEQWPVFMREIVRRLREGVISDRPAGG